MSYYFVRAEEPDFSRLGAAGWSTPLFDFRDPRLAQQIARARSAGVNYGFWGDPGQMNPEEFAKAMASTRQRYGGDVFVPDIEFVGKGYEGSPGWAYNQSLAQAWKQYLGDAQTAITVMPNQRDFNYGAWSGIADRWLPQAYGANPNKDIFDPNQIRQTLIDAGVDPNLITPVLGPGHDWSNYTGDTALWTADDFMANSIPMAQQRTSGASPAVATSPDMERFMDRNNPRAIEYANQRLAQLRRLGYGYEDRGDPTATWREASRGVTAAAQSAGFQNPRDWLRTGNPVKRPAPAKPKPPQKRPPVKKKKK